MTDAQLIAATLTGDRRSFAALVSRHQGVAWSVALSATGDAALAEDLTQEAFVIAWRKLAGLTEPDRFGPWLCGIVRNLVRSARRHQRRHAPAGADDRIVGLPSDRPSPLDEALARESLATAWEALARLPARYREPLLLYCHLDRCHARVAASLGITEETVRQRLSRARKKLRAGIDEVERAVESAGRRRRAGVAAAVVAMIAGMPRSGIAAGTSSALVPSMAAVASVCAIIVVGAGATALRAQRRDEPRAVAPAVSRGRMVSAAERPAEVSPQSAPAVDGRLATPARRARTRLRHGPAAVERGRPALLPQGRPTISMRDLGDLVP